MENFSLVGKTILITGATDGIGKQAALMLARMGARILLHGRNPEKAELVRQEIIQESNNPLVETVIADLQSLKQVRHLANEVKKTYRSPGCADQQCRRLHEQKTAIRRWLRGDLRG